MINVEEIKIKIIEILDQQGPSLPLQIARGTQLSPVFASAILSELVGEQKVRMSKLKFGSSPLYLLPGQEQKLESFADENLTGMEKKAYNRLKEEKIIDDITQEPAIRVALRSINDFAMPIRFQDKIIWKYKFITNEEAREIISKRNLNSPGDKTLEKIEEKPKIEEEPEVLEEKTILTVEESPEKIEEKEVKTKKKKETNEEFMEELKAFLLSKDIEFIKEVEVKKKEITAIVRVNSDLGKMSFLLIAKDKKKLNVADLTMAYQKAVTSKMPCYLISRNEPSKTAETFLEEHKNLLKIDSF